MCWCDKDILKPKYPKKDTTFLRYSTKIFLIQSRCSRHYKLESQIWMKGQTIRKSNHAMVLLKFRLAFNIVKSIITWSILS